MSLFRKSPRFVSRFGFVNDGDLESQYMSDFTDDGESQYLPVIEFPLEGDSTTVEVGTGRMEW